MKNFHNIEKLAGRNTLTGYCGGAIYQISKCSQGWRASHVQPVGLAHTSFTRRTLEGISSELERRANLPSLK